MALSFQSHLSASEKSLCLLLIAVDCFSGAWLHLKQAGIKNQTLCAWLINCLVISAFGRQEPGGADIKGMTFL